MAVSFITTIVKRPDEYDREKLNKVFKYLKGTKHMKLAFGVESLSVVSCCIDSSYNTHGDCGGYTRVMMSLSRDAVISYPLKQKLNMNSST